MPDEIRRIDYYYTSVPDKPGEGARILAALRFAMMARPCLASTRNLVADQAGHRVLVRRAGEDGRLLIVASLLHSPVLLSHAMNCCFCGCGLLLAPGPCGFQGHS